MKNLVLGLSLLFALSAQAGEFNTRLIEVEIPLNGEAKAMVLAQEEGRVLWADAQDSALLAALKEAQLEGHNVLINFDEESGEIFAAALAEETQVEDTFVSEKSLNNLFVPSVLPLTNAQSLFDRMDSNTKRRSQCYNRAHGWAYDMWRLAGVNSMKVFIFFTARYIKEHDYKWWFHVAPFVMVQNNQMSSEAVMDVSFTNGPTAVQAWTDHFMPNGTVCPTVEKYSDYRQNQWVKDCYLIKANMYYRSPRDLELLETEGRQELGWNEAEVREARKQAFRNWEDYNP